MHLGFHAPFIAPSISPTSGTRAKPLSSQRWPLILVILCLVMAVDASSASAQKRASKSKGETLPTQIQVSNEVAEGYQEAIERRTAILVLCFDGWSGDTAWEDVYTDSQLIRLSESYVTLLASGESGKDVDGKNGSVSERYGQLPTAILNKNMQRIYSEFASEEDPLVFPFYMILDSDRQILDRFHREFSPEELSKVLKKHQKSYPDAMTRPDHRVCRSSLDKATQALEIGDPETAGKALTTLANRFDKKRQKMLRAGPFGKQISDVESKLLSSVEEAIGFHQDWFKAGVEDESLIKMDNLLHAVACHDEAHSAVEKALKPLVDAAGEESASALKTHQKARADLLKAKQTLEKGRERPAIRALEKLIEKYPSDSPFVEEARELLAALKTP